MSAKSDDLADDIMCSCSGTKRSRIETLFKSGHDIDAISQWTGALSGCGGCEWDISGFLIELTKEAEQVEQTRKNKRAKRF